MPGAYGEVEKALLVILPTAGVKCICLFISIHACGTLSPLHIHFFVECKCKRPSSPVAIFEAKSV